MLLRTCSLTRLSANLFANEQYTFALVRFRLTERTNFCTHLTEQLLVTGFENNLRILVEGAGKGNTLLLTAGKLVMVALGHK